MSQLAKYAPFAALGLLLLAAAGCNEATTVDAKTLAEYRTRLALAEEPDGVQTVADVRVALLGEEHDPHAGHDHSGSEHVADGHATEEHAEHDAEDHAGHDEDGEDHEGHDDGHAAHDEDGEDHEDHDDGHAAHDEDGEGHDDDDDHVAHDHADHAAQGTESIDVNMVGHIGGLANPWAEAQPEFPFAKTQAVLFLSDPQGVIENEASGHSHAPGEECVFCAAHAADKADMLAMVQFLDKNGDVLPMDVRRLFDVKEKDTVVVSGKARVTAGGILVVDAQGLYIRK